MQGNFKTLDIIIHGMCFKYLMVFVSWMCVQCLADVKPLHFVLHVLCFRERFLLFWNFCLFAWWLYVQPRKKSDGQASGAPVRWTILTLHILIAVDPPLSFIRWMRKVALLSQMAACHFKLFYYQRIQILEFWKFYNAWFCILKDLQTSLWHPNI